MMNNLTHTPLARIGIISDTHMPLRYPHLPESIAQCFADVDLILHAGDVGELWVLDQLSAYAPVVAVHGNDETHEAQRELPYSQVVSVRGTRLLLCHSHHPDYAEEMASRRINAWQPKFERWAAMARRANASIFVYGHTHIPTAHWQAGILLVNPGAIASGSIRMRQIVQSVAVLSLYADQPPQVQHVNLTTCQPFSAALDLEGGFRAAFERYSESILAADLAEVWTEMEGQVLRLMHQPEQAATFERLLEVVISAATPCWLRQKDQITRAEMQAALLAARGDPHIPDSLLDTLLKPLENGA
ncbi:MAG: metallophosphoesterase [Chloroflexi bacterium CFX4]|nr:metallophosphoesterase [Chloroflexi bacterium CFX4]MDL1921933.1 metallophosphoesterase family protein [Chloroflexi bacterium CFX3]